MCCIVNIRAETRTPIHTALYAFCFYFSQFVFGTRLWGFKMKQNKKHFTGPNHRSQYMYAYAKAMCNRTHGEYSLLCIITNAPSTILCIQRWIHNFSVTCVRTKYVCFSFITPRINVCSMKKVYSLSFGLIAVCQQAFTGVVCWWCTPNESETRR